MPRLLRTGQAGTEKKGDIIVTVSPRDPGTGIQIVLTSPVEKKYDQQIRASLTEVLAQYEVTDAQVTAVDKSAWDYVIRARAEAAVIRALKQEGSACVEQ